MNKLVPFENHEGVGHLVKEDQALGFVEFLLSLQLIFKTAKLAKFRDDEDLVLLLYDLNQPDDVRTLNIL